MFHLEGKSKGDGEVYLKRSKIVSTLVVIWYTIELNAKKCVSSKRILERKKECVENRSCKVSRRGNLAENS